MAQKPKLQAVPRQEKRAIQKSAEERKAKAVDALPLPIKHMMAACQYQDQQGKVTGIVPMIRGLEEAARGLLEYSEQPTARAIQGWAKACLESYDRMCKEIVKG